jgi:hypothetical protein
MVTMPAEAGDGALIHHLLQQRMDCKRLNCAHDNPFTWARMVAHLRRAERAQSRSCRVVMDLAGPKLRTGPAEPGPAVLRIRPRRVRLVRVVTPARVWLTARQAPHEAPSPADACLALPAGWLAQLRPDWHLKLSDTRYGAAHSPPVRPERGTPGHHRAPAAHGRRHPARPLRPPSADTKPAARSSGNRGQRRAPPLAGHDRLHLPST